MSLYQAFTSTRLTDPDPAILLTRLKGFDATAGVQYDPVARVWKVKKATDWTAAQITSAQTFLDTCPEVTPQSLAQHEIDGWPISVKALVLTLIDQLNLIRSSLPVPLPAITPAQALSAIRTKAGTL